MPAATDTISADLSDLDATTSLYRAAIGSVGTDYYLPVFARFEASDRSGPSWNWAAAFLTLNWMAFRQLWPAAMVYAGVVTGVPLLVFGLGRLLLKWPPEVELGVLLTLLVALITVPGVYGNALFHAHCRKRMASALEANSTLPEACAMLERRASSRKRLVGLALGNAAIAAAALFAYAQATGYNPLATSSPGARQVAVGRTIELPTDVPAGLAPPAIKPPDAAETTPATPAPSAVPQAPPSSGNSSAPPRASSGLEATNTLASNRANPITDASATPSSAPATPAKAESQAAKPTSATDSPPPSATKSAETESKKPAPPKPLSSPPNKPSKEVLSSPAILASEAAQQAAAAAKELKRTNAPNQKKAASGEAVPSASKPTNAKSQPNKGAATNSPSAEPHFYINVGLFADENNALNAHVKLSDAGLPAFKQTLNTSKGKRTRVRVGPYDTEAQAEISANRIKSLGLEALVFESPNLIDATSN
ncbi:SPOR domain-containing protein [Rhodoferax aquaticus]|uniref:DUF2628 domain-containing protein n=1 Tax=Rhodoferax aquaticus TaxID=2527691 RepID=A0A515EPG6_9BURK|nr:SPOR domain-containing protein [Rhodoferax aquaticus]QDL54515.1 DUF2628 domain-containing protein [Rhodoferax aquaticus]